MLKKSIEDAEAIINVGSPFPAKRIKYCKNCSYYEFCFS